MCIRDRDGTESSIHNVQDAQKKGISIIHQEISLVPSLSIAENVFLGRELSKLGFKSEGKMFSMAQEMIDALDVYKRQGPLWRCWNPTV